MARKLQSSQPINKFYCNHSIAVFLARPLAGPFMDAYWGVWLVGWLACCLAGWDGKTILTKSIVLGGKRVIQPTSLSDLTPQ